MRVPVLQMDIPVVKGALPTGGQPNSASGFEDVAQGLGQVAQGVSRLGGEYERARRHAEELDNDKRLADLQRAINDGLEGTVEQPSTDEASKDAHAAGLPKAEYKRGYLSLRGEDAYKYSAETLDAFDKRRDELGSAIVSPRQRSDFSLKSQRLLDGARARVESHARGEYSVVRQANEKALMDEGLRAQRLAPGDDGVQRTQVELYAQSVRRDQVSEAEGTARINAYRATGVAARLDGLLGEERHDWKNAKRVLAQNREVLDSRVAAHYEDAIKKLEQYGADEAVAHGLVDATRDKLTGWADEAKAREAMGKLSDEDRRRIGPLVEKKLNDSDGLRAKQLKEWEDDALLLYRKGRMGAVRRSGALYKNLEEHDNAFLLQLERQEMMDGLRWESVGRARTNAAKGSDVDKEWLYRWGAMEEGERLGVDVDKWLLGSGVSPEGAEHIKQQQRRQQETKEKGLLIPQKAFVEGVVLGLQGMGLSKKKQEEAKAEAVLKYQELAKDGKPDDAAAEEAKRKLVQKSIVEKRWYGDKVRYGFEQEAEERRKQAAEPLANPPPLGALQLPGGKAKPAPAPAKKRRRIKDTRTGRMGTWDGEGALPPGVVEVSGG